MLLGVWGAALWTSQWVQSKALAGVRGETLIFFWNFSAWNKSNLAQNTFSLKVSLASVSHTIYFVMFSFYGKKCWIMNLSLLQIILQKCPSVMKYIMDWG